MSLLTDAQAQVNQVIGYAGEKIRIKYYNMFSPGSGYDDEKIMTQSGSDFWTSGLRQGINSQQGSDDAQYLQQGIILSHDSKLYVPGTTPTSGLIKIGMEGSPCTMEFQVLRDGMDIGVHVNADAAYKKLYIRFLKNGSLDGEQ
jgi:hypothetical protein